MNPKGYLRSRIMRKSGGLLSYSLRAEDSSPPCPTTPGELTELPIVRKYVAPPDRELGTRQAQRHSSRRACLSSVTASWPLSLPLLGYLPETNFLKLTLQNLIPQLAIISNECKFPYKFFKLATSITVLQLPWYKFYKFSNLHISKLKRPELKSRRTESSCSPALRKAFNWSNQHMVVKVLLSSL